MKNFINLKGYNNRDGIKRIRDKTRVYSIPHDAPALDT